MANLPHFTYHQYVDIQVIDCSQMEVNIDSGDPDLDSDINFHICGIKNNKIVFNVNVVKGVIQPLNALLKLKKFNICLEIRVDETIQTIYYKNCEIKKKKLISSFASFSYDEMTFLNTSIKFKFEDVEFFKNNSEYQNYIRKTKLNRIIK